MDHQRCAHLEPGHIVDLYQPQALASGLEAKVKAVFWEVDDNVLTEDSLHALVCSRCVQQAQYNTRQVQARGSGKKAWTEAPDWHI